MHTGAMNAQPKISAGFTLVEMMIAITLMAILMAIAVPSFRDASLGSQLRSTVNELVASVAVARSEAIKRNAVVTLCVSADGNACGAGGWEQGWIVFQGANLIQHQGAGATGFKVTEASGLNSLNFQPIGAGSTQATFTVCRATPSVGTQERVVTFNTTGRARINTTHTSNCQ